MSRSDVMRFQCLPLNLILVKVDIDNNQTIKMPTEIQANRFSLVILIYFIKHAIYIYSIITCKELLTTPLIDNIRRRNAWRYCIILMGNKKTKTENRTTALSLGCRKFPKALKCTNKESSPNNLLMALHYHSIM